MKVVHVGNIANAVYPIVKALRKKGVDAELYITYKERKEGNPVIPFLCDPRNFDKNLQKFPVWIKFIQTKSVFNILRDIRQLKGADIVQAYTLSPLYCAHMLRPLIVVSSGSDVREVLNNHSPMGVVLRYAYRKAKKVFYFNPDRKVVDGIRRGVGRKPEYLPPVVDTDFYKPGNGKEKEYILCTGSCDWRVKGTNILVKSFTELIKSKRFRKFRLVLMRRGSDFERTKELVKKLGVEDSVDFLNNLSAEELRKKITGASVCVGYCYDGKSGLPHFPTANLYYLSCGKKVISHMDLDAVKKAYNEDIPPITVTNSGDELTKALKTILIKGKTINSTRDWCIKYHGGEYTCNKLIQLYERVMMEK
ncbi:glycosyltransferase [Candidatus Woesearchaeota archaeon]|nr:glycosyltransferase [Candidatus Woesearchaeota archaeon]